MKPSVVSLDGLSSLAPAEFVDASYEAVLGRPPTPGEREQMLAALLRGDARTWLLGRLRYRAEGRRRGTPVPGLWARYAAQSLFRVPLVGSIAEWLNALIRLPSSLRHMRALAQLDAERQRARGLRDLARVAEIERRSDELESTTRGESERLAALLERRWDEIRRIREDDLRKVASLDQVHSGLLDRVRVIVEETRAEVPLRHADREHIRHLDDRLHSLSGAVERVREDHERLIASIGAVQSRLDAILPARLDEVLEVPGAALVSVAKERFGLSQDASIATLPVHERYALFETVFYESPAVAAKQRIYVPYLNHALGSQFPFLDLGCGRGEFLHILRHAGIEGIGVDINPVGIVRLRAEGFDVVEQDLIDFLATDRRTYSGASLLQVAEHLTDDQIERLLNLVAARLAPDAVFILETPNPLCGFALGVFHTDRTHLRPLPPERMRYEIEAAGFDRTRTLFQARIPHDQFAGPDPRAYYADYAVIASRSSS